MSKLIICAAITGSRITRDTTPHIPIHPHEIIQSAVECHRAGAAMVHIHVRDPQTGLGTQQIDRFRQVVCALREQTDLILCLTTSGIPGRHLPTRDRLAVLDLKPEIASFDAGSINLGGSVFINTPDFLEEAALAMRANQVKPELEIFDLGMMMTCRKLKDKGLLKEPLHFQFVLGTPWGAPATPKALLHLQEHLPTNSTWSATGIGKGHLPVLLMTLATGGHIRVGLEDNIYFRRGVLAESNAQFVKRTVQFAELYGRAVASPDEARQILGLT